MDSQPSGNDYDLLFIETEEVYFSIKGNKETIGYGESKSLTIMVEGKEFVEDINKYLYFKEYTNYEIVIERKNKTTIEFYHENPNIRNKVTPTGRGCNIISGIINFRGDIGYSDLYVMVNGNTHMKITIEVLPSKIDYKEDYEAILKDVNEEIYNLAYGFLSRTYLGTEINNRTSNSFTEFYSILNYVYENLMKSINIVLSKPHHELIKHTRVCKYQSLKSTSMDTIKWLEKRPHLLKQIEGIYIPTESLQVTKKVTSDTKENRFLKFILIKIIEKIDSFIRTYCATPWKKDKDIINKLRTMKKAINTKLKTSFLKDVESDYRNTSISLVFNMASGYREIYKYYLMLQKGLSINSNIFSLSMKELSLLYEYWCFIKINSLLKKKYKLVSSDLLKINKDGITVSLKKGVESSLTYCNPQTNEKFKVYYNSRRSSKTVSQKPDNILSMHKEGSMKSYEFIFDAKYKIDTSPEYIQSYGSVGPKEEDINTMHRYRDAIIYDYNKDKLLERKDKIKNPSEAINNCIFGAFVLFPYDNEEEFKNNKFFKSIEEINIGAIPFLPSTTKLMEDFLDEIIEESSYSSFERAIEPVGKEDYLKDEYFCMREVLVGALKSKAQLEVNLKYNFYHIPAKKINLAKNNIKYVALAQSSHLFGSDGGIVWYGKIKDIHLVQRNEIIELPKNDESLYYRLEIEKWFRLERKIEIAKYQVRSFIYTTFYLLNNADSITELCIKSKEEFRLFLELKRLYNDISIEGDNIIGAESEIKAFNLDGINIVINDESIMSVADETVIKVSKDDFIKKPIKSIKRLLRK